jgi:hypothetical protein
MGNDMAAMESKFCYDIISFANICKEFFFL